MNDLLLQLLQQGVTVLLQILLLGILAGLVWIRKELKQYIVSQTTVQEREWLSKIGKEAFIYAETVFGALDGPGKLNEATKYMIHVLNQQGMQDVPMKEIRTMIEQAWLEDRHKAGRPVEKPVPPEIR